MARVFSAAREWFANLSPDTCETLRYGRQLLQYVAAVYVVDQHVVHLSLVRCAARAGSCCAGCDESGLWRGLPFVPRASYGMTRCCGRFAALTSPLTRRPRPRRRAARR